MRIPHVGWNRSGVEAVKVRSSTKSPIMRSFISRIAIICNALTKLTSSRYRTTVLASSPPCQKGNIFGTQFDPEKSQWHGLSLLRNFATKVVGC